MMALGKGPLHNLKQDVATSYDLVDGPFGLLYKGGTAYYLDPANGNDNNDGLTPATAVATLPIGYAKLTANTNDTLYYLAGSSSISLSAQLTWAKAYTHLVGVTAPTRIAQRARIFQTATATGLSPLINVTASSCSFWNIYTFQGVDDATSLINWQVTGSRNYFNNCHFAGGGHATQAVNGGASMKVNAGSENTWENCTFGVDTIAAATGMTALTFDGSASRNTFNGCKLQLMAGNAGAMLVELIDATSLDRWTDFNYCSFFSNSVNKATTIDTAFEIPAGHTTTASIFVNNPVAALGFTDWDDNDRGILYLNVGTITGGGNSGFSVVSAVA
jgi:hypothetical protein